jgi:hypothetical protein
MCNKHSMFGQTPVIYTCTYTQSHKFNTFTQAQYSVYTHEKHSNSPKRCKIGKNVGWQGRQLVVFQRKITVSRRNRELGNQLPGILRKAYKQYIYINTHIHIQYLCLYV